MSDTSAGQLAFVKETTAGVAPATPAFLVLDFMSETLSMTSNSVRSQAVTSQRVVKSNRRAGKEVSGQIVFELYKGPEVDALLASLLGNAFTGTPLTAIAGGSVVDTYTFERKITATQYRRFSGCRIASAEFQIQPEQIVQVTLTVTGFTETTGTAIITGATYTAPASVGKLTAIDVQSVTLSNGLTATYDYSMLRFTVNNQTRVNKRVGPATVRSVGVGQVLVTGNVSIYIDDNTSADAFVADTHFNMDAVVQLAASGYTFSFKNNAITAQSDPNTGNNNEFMSNIEFEATLDSTYGSSFGIAKTS